MTDLIAHLTRQAVFGRATFGPGPRTEGVLKHIESEIEEVRRAAAQDDLNELVKEWTDMAILSLDGLLRAVRAQQEQLNRRRMNSADNLVRDGISDIATAMNEAGVLPFVSHEMVARLAANAIVQKQSKNELRDWPDWRDHSEDQPIEHDRTKGVQ